MKKIDELIEFLWERKNDDRISISKDKKYGYRNYYIKFEIDEKPEEDEDLKSNSIYRLPFKLNYGNAITIHIDNRNECINAIGNKTIIDEDIDLVNKWSQIIEDHLNNIYDRDIDEMIETTFSSCYRKDFHRDWKMKKIFDDEDESL